MHNDRIKIIQTTPDHRRMNKDQNFYVMVDDQKIGALGNPFFKTKTEAYEVAETFL